MLYDELDHIIIDQALLVLKCIHKSFFTDPVDHTWDPGRCFMDLIQRFGCKDLLGTSGVIHMACDILFCLRSVQVWQGTVHINALADCGIPLQFQLVFPQFGRKYVIIRICQQLYFSETLFSEQRKETVSL